MKNPKLINLERSQRLNLNEIIFFNYNELIYEIVHQAVKDYFYGKLKAEQLDQLGEAFGIDKFTLFTVTHLQKMDLRRGTDWENLEKRKREGK